MQQTEHTIPVGIGDVIENDEKAKSVQVAKENQDDKNDKDEIKNEIETQN